MMIEFILTIVVCFTSFGPCASILCLLVNLSSIFIIFVKTNQTHPKTSGVTTLDACICYIIVIVSVVATFAIAQVRLIV